MNQKREILWQPILKNWLRKPRSITYSRYFSYLPGRISHYLNNDSMEIRKDRVNWLSSLIIKYDMREIDQRFYELVPQETTDDSSDISHPYDVNWDMYDSLQPSKRIEMEGNSHVSYDYEFM